MEFPTTPLSLSCFVSNSYQDRVFSRCDLDGLVKNGKLLMDIPGTPLRKGDHVICPRYYENSICFEYSPYLVDYADDDSTIEEKIDMVRYRQDHPDDQRSEANIYDDLIRYKKITTVRIPMKVTVTLGEGRVITR